MENNETLQFLEEEIIEVTEEHEAVEVAEEISDSSVSYESEIDDLKNLKLSLEGEIAMLDAELSKKRDEVDRRAREYSEFKELYPDVELSAITPEVISASEAGVPLAAAYALYEKRMAVRAEVAQAHNKVTKENGFGSVGKNTASEFFSPDEVRSMSASEVHANYQKILRSMRSWS